MTLLVTHTIFDVICMGHVLRRPCDDTMDAIPFFVGLAMYVYRVICITYLHVWRDCGRH